MRNWYQRSNISEILDISFRKINGYIEDYDRSKCLTLIPIDEKNKEVLKKSY